VSSSFASNPINEKEKIWIGVKKRVPGFSSLSALDIVKSMGDPMIPVAAGVAAAFSGELLLAGGTQMLSVAAVIKSLGGIPPRVVTTCYVRDDPLANVQSIADQIGVSMHYVDPSFGDLGHSGLARYCIGEVKEGMGAGGAMCLAYLLGYTADEIRQKILSTVTAYC
jgi:NaMN:DMB phosphoribosyltransferase